VPDHWVVVDDEDLAHGYGSVMMALRHGVRILAAGKREGENEINTRLAYGGLGIDLSTERPSPKQLARGAARILADERIPAQT
jgi:hypothetical protein